MSSRIDVCDVCAQKPALWPFKGEGDCDCAAMVGYTLLSA